MITNVSRNMLKRKKIDESALNKLGIKNRFSIAAKQRKLVEQKFERLKKTKPELQLEKQFIDGVRNYMDKKRKNGFGVDEKMLKNYMYTIKEKLVKGIVE
ncbi:hypothetical protein NH26_24530 [Flammeovirga pacifica]|uniref:Uncharacterized protein n=2 Tax=Flammeovirga pacifica TaxID=915059 RepID=A0A1S1YV43_FLAPC|nr:hypothetical protein NH26_24530 [Flammeovirga pacifica]